MMIRSLRIFRTHSLQTKLYLCLFFLIVLPLLVTTLLINTDVLSNVDTQTRETVFQTMEQAQFNIENALNEVEDISLTLSSDRDLQALGDFYAQLPHIADPSPPFNQAVATANYTLFLTTKALLPGKTPIYSLCFSNKQGIIYQYGTDVVTEDTRFDKMAAELKGIGFWTPVYRLRNTYDPTQSTYVVSFIRAVNDINAPRQLGVERVSINVNTLWQYYEEVTTWNNAQSLIVDSTGHIISSPNQQLLGTSMSTISAITQALNEQDGFFLSTVHNERSTVFHYAIQGTGWQMISIVPDSDLNTPLALTNLLSSFLLLLCILFGLFFSFIQYKTVISPLKHLGKEMQKIPKGDFDIKIDHTSKDEIGTLGLVFTEMTLQLQQYIEREYKAQLKQREAELRALQAQINPHFLYNTLDTIRWTALDHGDYTVGEQLEALAELFRHVFNKGDEMTTVGEEIEHVKQYLLLQQSRFREKLEITFEVDPEVLSFSMLKLLLQPLVENAVYHGIERKREKGRICLRVESDAKELRFTIMDDGAGVDEQEIRRRLANEQERPSVFALKNIHERIQLAYGNAYGLTFHSNVGLGTTTEIRLPIQDNDFIKDGDQ